MSAVIAPETATDAPRRDRGPDGKFLVGNRARARSVTGRRPMSYAERVTRNAIVRGIVANGCSKKWAQARAGEWLVASRVLARIAELSPEEMTTRFAQIREAQKVQAAVLEEAGLRGPWKAARGMRAARGDDGEHNVFPAVPR